jgi:hypothetical protein
MARVTTLWHYTNAVGLHGIITRSELWFGDGSLLNDRTEQVYGELLLDKIIHDTKLDDPYDIVKEAVASLDSTRHPIRLYICSLSETAKSISQWQRYGADGAGYCIGFNVSRLTKLFGEHVSLKKMLYRPEKQRSAILQTIHDAIRDTHEWPTIDRSSFEFQKQMRSMRLSGDIDALLMQIKNPHFADEREWRFVYMLNGAPDVFVKKSKEEFRVGGPYIKPYIAFPRSESSSLPRLPITSIVCGPRLDPEISLPSVRRFVQAKGFPGVAVESSELRSVWR